MAKAVAARLQGDDYQIRFFWMQVCRLFEDRTKVVSVELESDDVKSLDDVVVRYKDYSEMGEPIDADFFQVKFHVTANGAFTWRLMMDPSFVNASSVSILQRLLNAQRKHAPKGCGCRFQYILPYGPFTQTMNSRRFTVSRRVFTLLFMSRKWGLNWVTLFWGCAR